MFSASSLQWLSLVSTFWLQSINGANSDFPIYSSQLKNLKHISQVGLNFLAFASDAGKLFGWLSGIAALYLPLWLVAVIGTTLGLIGYGLQFLFIQHPHFTYFHIFILTTLAGNGICWINTVCYLISIKNFRSNSRVAVALSTSYVGLSAKVYTVIATSIFNQESTHNANVYLLLNALAPLVVTFSVLPFLRVIETASVEPKSDLGFMVIFFVAVATGLCAVLGSIGHLSQGFSFREYNIGLGLLLAAPLVVPFVLKLRQVLEVKFCKNKETKIHDLSIDELEKGQQDVEIEPELKEQIQNHIEDKEDQLGGLLILREVNFWLYFFSYMFSATPGLVFLNNLGQIAEARGLKETSNLVSFSSSFGFFGRLIPFLLDHYCSRRKCQVSRPASLATLMIPISGAFFMLLNPSRLVLYVSTSIIGACTGAITSIAVSGTSELFGTKYFSVNHNIVITNIPIGSFIFGYFAAFVYQQGSEGSNICVGTKCYDKTFVVWGFISSIGTLLCIVLYIRTRKFC